GSIFAIFTLTSALLLAETGVQAADPTPSELSSQKDKVSYSIGMSVGRNLKRGGYDVNVDTLAEAIKDILSGKEPKLTDAQSQEIMTAYTKELRQKQEEERVKLAEKNKKSGEEFLAENKKKPGIKTKTVTLP